MLPPHPSSNDRNFLLDTAKNLDIDLSEEEMVFLEMINSKFAEKISKKIEEKGSYSDHHIENDPDLFSAPNQNNKHITDYEREIFVNLTMEISAINSDGFYTELAQILESSYHIPVPTGVNYQEKVDNFLTKFDEQLSDCAYKIAVSDNSNGHQ